MILWDLNELLSTADRPDDSRPVDDTILGVAQHNEPVAGPQALALHVWSAAISAARCSSVQYIDLHDEDMLEIRNGCGISGQNDVPIEPNPALADVEGDQPTKPHVAVF